MAENCKPCGFPSRAGSADAFDRRHITREEIDQVLEHELIAPWWLKHIDTVAGAGGAWFRF
jgi:hypothetical protein